MESSPSESDCSKSDYRVNSISEKRIFDNIDCDESEDPENSRRKKPKVEQSVDEETLCDIKAKDKRAEVAESASGKPKNTKQKNVKSVGGKNKDAASRKKQKLEKEENSANGSKAKEKPKGNMRRNIREILKDNELEAETRAAQQRELERIQRLQQQQQQIEASFSDGFNLPGENTRTSDLVEDLHALAKELEDSNLSPEAPIPLIDDVPGILGIRSTTSDPVDQVRDHNRKSLLYVMPFILAGLCSC